MSYKQIKSFSPTKAGKKKGWCLQNVRLGFGIGSKYLSAWQAWQHAPQYKSSIPKGVDVPLYYWYKNGQNGHINVQLANGKCWSDGRVYSSVRMYRLTHPLVKYQGWSTQINGVAVLKQVADPAKPAVGKTVHLSANVSKWAVYPLNKPPVKKNAKAYLKPHKFRGLDYKLLAKTKWPNTWTIKTEDFGKVNIYLDKDASIK